MRQLARETPRWGSDRIEREVLKLGDAIDRSTLRNLLQQQGIPPVSNRLPKSTWRTFLRHYQHPMFACDCFTIETLWLKTVSVLFFIERGTRRVPVAGCTEHPTSVWVTQPARQRCWKLEARTPTVRSRLHDHDPNFPASFDQVFAAQQIEVICTPIRAPNANAFAERWVRSIRQECLNHLLIVNERHLKAVLLEATPYDNRRRPHQGLGQHFPEKDREILAQGAPRRRDIRGGIVHDYYGGAT